MILITCLPLLETYTHLSEKLDNKTNKPTNAPLKYFSSHYNKCLVLILRTVKELIRVTSIGTFTSQLYSHNHHSLEEFTVISTI